MTDKSIKTLRNMYYNNVHTQGFRSDKSLVFALHFIALDFCLIIKFPPTNQFRQLKYTAVINCAFDSHAYRVYTSGQRLVKIYCNINIRQYSFSKQITDHTLSNRRSYMYDKYLCFRRDDIVYNTTATTDNKNPRNPLLRSIWYRDDSSILLL